MGFEIEKDCNVQPNPFCNQWEGNYTVTYACCMTCKHNPEFTSSDGSKCKQNTSRIRSVRQTFVKDTFTKYVKPEK